MTRSSSIPGRSLSLGVSLAYVSVLVLLPLSLFAATALQLSPGEALATLADPRTLGAYRVSIIGALCAACINAPFGAIVAWAIVRGRFRGRRALDAIVDVPFAVPTAVVGIALASAYAPATLAGRTLASLGLDVASGTLGVTLAMMFVSLPFAVRTVQPVLEDLDPGVEQAAASLGAGSVSTFARVILPQLLPAIATGMTLSFAKSVGEYGAVIFVAGNVPRMSEVAPLLVMVRLEEFRYAQAAIVASGLLVMSLIVLSIANVFLSRMGRLA
jgi:sulfate transport system permease protein